MMGNRMMNRTPAPVRRQQGSTLIVAIILLLLGTLVSILAMNVGVFEQRSSGNDLRAKLVKQVAEAGLAQGFEYLFRANPALMDNPGAWEICAASDEKFPCGAVPAAIRSSTYRLKAGVGGYSDPMSNKLASALTQYMLPTASNRSVGGFDVAYGVAPLLCRVSLPVSATTINCATNMSNLSDRRVVTFVGVAQVRGDSGRTTLTQTISRSSLLAQGNEVASVVASGNVQPSGNGDVIAMPNAAGPGLDVSIWTRQDVDMKSAFGTCDLATYLASSNTSLSDPNWRANSISGGCPKKGGEGWDVLDRDSDNGVNMDVDPDEFPCDLFEYAFGVNSWKTPNDGLCTQRVDKSLVEVNGQKHLLYPDEAFLYQNATQIIGDDLGLARADQIKGNPGSTSSGLIWCKSGCDKGVPGNPAELGSPTAPVAFVVDGEMKTNSTIIYGMVFMRDPNTTLDPGTGGVAAFKQNGSKAAVFGTVFVQGEYSTGSGNGPVVGDPAVLSALANLPNMSQFNTLRGGWTDRYSY